MTANPANRHSDDSPDPARLSTLVAFVLFATLGGLCVVWGWALVLPQLRVIVIDYTDSAIGWFRFLDFIRIASVLTGAVASGLIASNIASRRHHPHAGGGG
jgi:hypothetical protein